MENIERGLVSVIVPCFNMERYVKNSLTSALEQTYNNLEVLFVDDFSTDKCADIARELSRNDARVRVFSLPDNSGGPAKPRNVGLANARGEYIAFLDPDDLWEPEKLERQIHVLERSDRVGLVCCWAMHMDANGRTVDKWRPRWLIRVIKHLVSFEYLLLLSNIFIMSSVCLRRSLLEGLEFDTDCALVAVEDWTLWLRLSRARQQFVYRQLEVPLVSYRAHSGSISKRDSELPAKRAIYMFAKLYHQGFISFGELLTAVGAQVVRRFVLG